MANYEELDSMIRESYTPSAKELILLWNKMGLSTEEVETRMTTVVMKISDIVLEMVKCDRENKRKIEDACDDLKKDIGVMWKTLKKDGEIDLLLPCELTLLEQQRQLKTNLLSLVKEGNDLMEEFRSLIEEERSLAVKLGLDAVRIDEDTIPDKDDMDLVQDSLRRLVRVKEDREGRLWIMKEQIVTLRGKLGMKVNTMADGDGDEEFNSLKLADLRSMQHIMDELERSVEERKVEVQVLLNEIESMYRRLDIPFREQCPLLARSVCGDEDLIKEEILYQLKDEKYKLEEMKIANIKVIVNKAKSELSELWDACMVGEVERELFWNNLDKNYADKMLVSIDVEISKVEKYQIEHKVTFLKLSLFIELCDLAKDLKERMKDPNRLLKSRGKELMKEEQDRKKVNAIPKRKEELLTLVEQKGNIMIYDKMMSVLVEEHALRVLKMFPPPVSISRVKNKQSNPLSSNSNGKSFDIHQASNKTASPQSTKKLGKSYKSPVPGAGGSRTLRTTTAIPRSTKKLGKSYKSPVHSAMGSRTVQTPKTASPKSTKKLEKSSYKSPAPRTGNSSSRTLRTPKSMIDSVRSYKMKNSSPVSKPVMRMNQPNTPLSMSKTNVFREIKNSNVLHDGTIDESTFSENVPHNSTVCAQSTRTLSPVTTVYTDNGDMVILSDLRDRLGPARDVASLQDSTLRQPSSSHGMEGCKSGAGGLLASQDKNCKTAGKLRRSNSCSDLSLSDRNQRKPLTRRESEHWEYSELGISTVDESDSTAFLLDSTCTVIKEGSGKISRTGSCSDLLL